MMRWPRFRITRATHRTCTTSVRTGTWSPGAALMTTAVIRPSWVASTTRSPTFGATGLSSSIHSSESDDNLYAADGYSSLEVSVESGAQ